MERRVQSYLWLVINRAAPSSGSSTTVGLSCFHTLFLGRTNCTENLQPRTETQIRTFSDVLSVSMSCFFCVKMMLKTAWERLLVSFMLVAATVLKRRKWFSQCCWCVLCVVVFYQTSLYLHRQAPTHRALLPESIRSWMSLYEVTASLERSST